VHHLYRLQHPDGEGGGGVEQAATKSKVIVAQM
jgi:hypothetical protein